MILVVEDGEKVESKVHKSLAEILGIPKRGEVVEQKKVAVVIDPKLTKVLRPHQIEGVKVPSHSSTPLMLVSLPCNDRKNPRRSIRMYHGRRNGSRKNCTPPTTESESDGVVTMYCITLDITSSISYSPTTNHPEMYHRMSLLPRQKLGQRTR